MTDKLPKKNYAHFIRYKLSKKEEFSPLLNAQCIKFEITYQRIRRFMPIIFSIYNINVEVASVACPAFYINSSCDIAIYLRGNDIEADNSEILIPTHYVKTVEKALSEFNKLGVYVKIMEI